MFIVKARYRDFCVKAPLTSNQPSDLYVACLHVYGLHYITCYSVISIAVYVYFSFYSAYVLVLVNILRFKKQTLRYFQITSTNFYISNFCYSESTNSLQSSIGN